LTEPPPNEGRLAAAATVVKGLSWANLLTIAALVVIAIPSYFIWKTLNDPVLLDRMLSSYKEESSQQTGCTLRTAKQRGGVETWAVSTGWAFHGGDRYYIAVAMNRAPAENELAAYCATLKLLAEKLGQPPI